MTPSTIPREPEVLTMNDPADHVAAAPVLVEDRIRAFVSDEHRRVVATISLWTGDLDTAVDAVTDALGRAWERLDRGETIDNLAAWVTRAAMNQIRSEKRRASVAKRHRHLIAVADTIDDPASQSPARLDLRRALTSLGERQRTIVALHYGLGRSTQEIAEDLRIAPGTVKATLHQARGRLAQLLEKEEIR